MHPESEILNLISLCHPEIPAGFAKRLLIFYREIVKWNKTINLISRKTPKQTAIKLIIEALFLLQTLRGEETILDIGAGAGFPSIPILLCSNVKITMVESRLKRATFLKHLVHTLTLHNAKVLVETVNEGFFKIHSKPYDILWAKAALPMEHLFRLGRIGLRRDGRLLLFQSFEKKGERNRLHDLALEHGFTPPVYKVFSCPDLYLIRTIAFCKKV